MLQRGPWEPQLQGVMAVGQGPLGSGDSSAGSLRNPGAHWTLIMDRHGLLEDTGFLTSCSASEPQSLCPGLFPPFPLREGVLVPHLVPPSPWGSHMS